MRQTLLPFEQPYQINAYYFLLGHWHIYKVKSLLRARRSYGPSGRRLTPISVA